MKIRKCLIVLLFSIVVSAPAVGYAAWDWTGRFPYGIVPFKLSLIQPFQMPVPWYGYNDDASSWGMYSVYGIDLGLESSSDDLYGLAVTGLAWGGGATAGLDVAVVSIRDDVYGLQLGGGVVAKGWCCGWQLAPYTYGRKGCVGLQTGILNMAGVMRGVQIGVANSAHDLKGVQIGLININLGGPLAFFPVLNAGF